MTSSLRAPRKAQNVAESDGLIAAASEFLSAFKKTCSLIGQGNTFSKTFPWRIHIEFPDAPCMAYLPTFGSVLRYMLVNIPYMENTY